MTGFWFGLPCSISNCNIHLFPSYRVETWKDYCCDFYDFFSLGMWFSNAFYRSVLRSMNDECVFQDGCSDFNRILCCRILYEFAVLLQPTSNLWKMWWAKNTLKKGFGPKPPFRSEKQENSQQKRVLTTKLGFYRGSEPRLWPIQH